MQETFAIQQRNYIKEDQVNQKKKKNRKRRKYNLNTVACGVNSDDVTLVTDDDVRTKTHKGVNIKRIKKEKEKPWTLKHVGAILLI